MENPMFPHETSFFMRNYPHPEEAVSDSSAYEDRTEGEVKAAETTAYNKAVGGTGHQAVETLYTETMTWVSE